MYRHLYVFVPVIFTVGCAVMPAPYNVETPPQPVPLQPLSEIKKPVVGIALGGGATRGFAHIGVLNTLEQNGIAPDIVVGTSAGAVTGVLYAGGIRGEKLAEIAMQLNRQQIVDWSYSGRGFIRGEALQEFINQLLDNRPIEDLPTIFAATATDLDSGELVVFTKGDAGLAVRASSVIPGLVSPVTINDHDYVDGGLISKIPVQITRQLGADIVIAVDVSRKPAEHLPLDSTFAVMEQAINILSQRMIENNLRDADVIIHPDIGAIPLGNFEHREQTIHAGETAAIAAIPTIKQLMIKANQESLKSK